MTTLNFAAPSSKWLLTPRSSWRAGELATLCGISERHFFRLFKMKTGLSPIDWLRRERIRRAEAMLLKGGRCIKQIAPQVSYNDAYFLFAGVQAPYRTYALQLSPGKGLFATNARVSPALIRFAPEPFLHSDDESRCQS
jgi:AraC-like DNA-binding protein